MIEESVHIVKRTESNIAAVALMVQMGLQTIPSMGIKPESTKTAQERFSKQVRSMLEGS